MNPYVLIAVLLFGVATGAGGYRATFEAACAADMPGSCPTAIKNAFAKNQLVQVQKEVEVRDKIIPVIVHDNAEDQARQQQLQADIDQLNTVEKTDACASSPAFRLRRQQLCDAVGGGDCPETSR